MISRRVALPVGIGLAVALLLGTDVLPWIRGPENWRWGYRPLPVGRVVFVLLALAGAMFATHLFSTSRTRIRRAASVAFAVVVLFAEMVMLSAAEPRGLSNVARRVMDPAFTSYHTIARDVGDPADFLSRYHRLQPRFPVHGPSQPPGRVLFFWAVNRVVEETGLTTPLLEFGEAFGDVPRGLSGTTDVHRAGAVLAGFLLLFAGALCLVPVLAVLETHSARTAAMALMFTLPSFVLFTPQTDHLILLTTLTAAAATVAAFRRRERAASYAWCALAGFVAGAGVFVSFTTLAALAAWALGIVLWIVSTIRSGDRVNVRWVTGAAIVWGVAFLAVPLWAYRSGMDWIAVFEAATAAAHRVQVFVHGRVYSTWVVWNLWDFALFLGPPLVWAWLLQVRGELRNAARPEFPGPTLWGVALLVTLIALDVSGRILGETGRIWMFLMPLAVCSVATSLPDSDDFSWSKWSPLLAGQALVLVALRMFVNVPG